MKTFTKIRNEKPYYFVSIQGNILFESESIRECKQWFINYLKEHKKDIIQENETWDYFIGMYNIDIEGY